MLLLISPSQTEAERDNLWLGNQDSKLSEDGRAAATEFAKHAGWIKPARLYTSPAAHVREFAETVLPAAERQSMLDFADRSMGTLTGRSYRETLAEFPRRNWLAWQRQFWIAPPGGESMFDISERVLTAFRTKVLPIPAAETVVILCAPDIIRLVVGYLTHVEEEEVMKLKVEPVVPYVINGDIEVSK